MSFLYVRVYHGPCNTFENNEHKPQLLAGIRDHLRRLGFRVDLIPVEFANYCMLEMCGHEIFRCNIRNLKFNTTHKNDVVSSRAIAAVIEASVKFRRARAFLWIWTLLNAELFRRNAYAPKDYWQRNVIVSKPSASYVKCIQCCGMDVHLDEADD